MKRREFMTLLGGAAAAWPLAARAAAGHHIGALPQVGEEIGEQRQRVGLTLHRFDHVVVVSGRGAGLVGAIHIFIPIA